GRWPLVVGRWPHRRSQVVPSKAGVRGPKPEVRSPRSEVRRPKSEVRRPNLTTDDCYNELLAAGPDGRSSKDGRKVRAPQSSVPDNVREGAPSKLAWAGHSTESATENIPPRRQRRGKGEKVR